MSTCFWPLGRQRRKRKNKNKQTVNTLVHTGWAGVAHADARIRPSVDKRAMLEKDRCTVVQRCAPRQGQPSASVRNSASPSSSRSLPLSPSVSLPAGCLPPGAYVYLRTQQRTHTMYCSLFGQSSCCVIYSIWCAGREPFTLDCIQFIMYWLSSHLFAEGLVCF